MSGSRFNKPPAGQEQLRVGYKYPTLPDFLALSGYNVEAGWAKAGRDARSGPEPDGRRSYLDRTRHGHHPSIHRQTRSDHVRPARGAALPSGVRGQRRGDDGLVGHADRDRP